MIKKIKNQIDEIAFEVKCLTNGMYPKFVVEKKSKWASDQIPIFTFHGVEPFIFEEEMTYLKENSYKTLPLDDLMRFLTGSDIPNEKGVVITFDDGYESVWTIGGPILRQFGFHAIAYIVPRFVGTPGYLSWDQVKEMKNSGIFDIQSHSLSHRVMQPKDSNDLSNLGAELAISKKMIEANLPGHTVNSFCFPYGKGCDEVVELSKNEGYLNNMWITRPDRRTNKNGDDPFYIVRLKHDFILRLPGINRKSLFFVFKRKLQRRLHGKAFV